MYIYVAPQLSTVLACVDPYARPYRALVGAIVRVTEVQQPKARQKGPINHGFYGRPTAYCRRSAGEEA